jgi:hypothetical protein
VKATAKNGSLMTEIQENSGTVTGTLISPYGHALPDLKVSFLLAQWEKILGPGDFAPGVHIPGGGRMSLDVCGKSLKQADDFYRKYFPEKKVKAFVCVSWIFNTQFESELPESNIANLMRQVYLFPCRSNGKDGGFFIFGKDSGDISRYPTDNSVRNAMLNILDSGRRLRSGGMFILPEHLDRFGEEYYRNNLALPAEMDQENAQ